MGEPDHEARAAAAQASARIDKHEAICAERYEALERRLDAGAKVMRELRYWLYAITGLLVIGEGSVLDVAKRVFLNAPH